MRRRSLAALLVTSLLLIAALAAPATQAGGGCHMPGAGDVYTEGDGTTVIRMDVCSFAPTISRVAVGTTVRFLNTSTIEHAVVGRSGTWGSEILPVGKEFSETFAAAALGAGRGLEVPARALGFRGSARCALGDPAELEELRAALALALDRGEGRDTAVLYNNLGDALLPVEGPASVLATYRQGIEFARRRGIGELAAAMVAGSLDRLIEVGEWDRALADAEAMADRAEAEGNVSELLLLRRAQVRVLVGRGQTGPARPLADWLVEAARESGGTEEVLGAFTAARVRYIGTPSHATYVRPPTSMPASVSTVICRTAMRGRALVFVSLPRTIQRSRTLPLSTCSVASPLASCSSMP